MILKYPPNGISPQAGVWLLYTLICLAGGALKLSTIGINVAVEREWATLIAKDANLTKLNAYMRRIDLLSKLVAPLFVSLLTSTRGYSFAVIFLASFAVGCGIFEFFWIQVVYNRFDVLRRDDERKKQVQEDRIEQTRSLKRWLTEEIRLWRKFSDDPAFFTSVAISLLYITVLSFEGAMIGYLVWRGFSDPFIGAMRAVNVITGLLGTVLGPQLIKKVGLVRAGNWSIWSETVSLIPVVISFFLTPQYRGDTSPVYTSVLLFTGMALSRAPLWMFDLTQLQIVQESFNAEDRASLMSLQFSLQNMGDLLQYVITLIIRDPAQFRYAALISFICVAAGALVYSIGYARRVRGHLFHRYVLHYSRAKLIFQGSLIAKELMSVNILCNIALFGVFICDRRLYFIDCNNLLLCSHCYWELYDSDE